MNIGMKRGGLIALLLALMLLVSMFAAAPAQAKGEAAVLGAAPKTAEVSQNDAAGDAPEAAPAEKNQVEAATVDELLKAIAPNTVITLTGRSYDLTRAQGYGVYGSKWYGWNDIYDDGWELEIDNVEGLTIRASRPGTEIITVPRYACVMKFVNCADVVLEGFTAGHSEGPGFCTGAVLNMQGCRNMSVSRCDLYGCGTYGLELERCQGIHTVDSTIRDCSYGAISAGNCRDVLLDGCSIYGIEGVDGVFSLSACRDCALINSVVRSNSSSSLLSLNSVKNFYMAGCEISKNTFEGMFTCTPYPAVIEGCVFADNTCYHWYQENWKISERVVRPDGTAYSDEELAALTLMGNVSWTAPESEEPTVVAPEASEDGQIHVHNVDELLAAIAPNANIYLEDGVYDLSEAAGYGYADSEYWYWMDCYDGPGLVIRGVENLRIAAAGPHRAGIVAVPRYCEVLSFEGCKNISLSGFTAGHTQEPGACAGGVLSFMQSRGFRIEDCSLFGCGIVGVTCMSSGDGEIQHTEIHDCSDGAFYFYDSLDIRISECNIHDIPNYTYQIFNCGSITADGRALPEGASW